MYTKKGYNENLTYNLYTGIDMYYHIYLYLFK